MTAHQVIKQELAGGRHQGPVTYPQSNSAPRPDQRQLRPGARQQRRPRLHAVELLPAGLPAADRQDAVRPAQLGAVQLAGRLDLVQQAASRPADRHRQAELDLPQLEKDFLAAAAGDPALVQRRLVPGQHPVWSDFPASTGSDQNIPAMWAGYLGAMTTVHGAGQPDADPSSRELTQPRSAIRLIHCGPVSDPPPARAARRRVAGPLIHLREPASAALSHQETDHLCAGVLRRRDHRLGHPAPDAGRPDPGPAVQVQRPGLRRRTRRSTRRSPSRSASTCRSGSSTWTSGRAC